MCTDTRDRRFQIVMLTLLVIGSLLVSDRALSQAVTFHRGDEPMRMMWKKRPLRINLSVGDERLIDFPEPVMVGAPPEVANVLRTQIVEGTVYWLARGTFDETRIQVRGIDSGRVYLFDVSGEDGAPRFPDVVVVDPRNPSMPAYEGQEEVDSDWNYVTLTRFASQQLYAPERLTEALGTLFRAPVNPAAVGLLRGGRVEAKPLASWRGGSYYITAVRLRNVTDSTIDLDPRDLRGAWLTATFQHPWLSAVGSDADTTAVYLVSSQPFDESMTGGH